MTKIGKLLKKIVSLSGCMSVCVSVITNEKNWKSFQKMKKIGNLSRKLFQIEERGKKLEIFLENEKNWKYLQNDR